jgi:hypothetical protein
MKLAHSPSTEKKNIFLVVRIQWQPGCTFLLMQLSLKGRAYRTTRKQQINLYVYIFTSTQFMPPACHEIFFFYLTPSWYPQNRKSIVHFWWQIWLKASPDDTPSGPCPSSLSTLTHSSPRAFKDAGRGLAVSDMLISRRDPAYLVRHALTWCIAADKKTFFAYRGT